MANPSSTNDRRDQVDVLALIDHFVLGGAETMLARFALAAPRAGIRLSIACLREWDGNPAAAPLLAAGLQPTDLHLIGRPGLHALRAVRSHIAHVRPQLVHTHLGTSDLLGSMAARSLGIPLISTVHSSGSPRRRDEVSRRIVRSCAARVIAVSESTRQEYLGRGWARADQMVTIHNGVEVSAEPGSGAQVRRDLGLAPDDLVVVMLSALRPEKAHDVAIDAVELLLPKFPKLRLLIAGQGAEHDAIARRSARLGGAVVMTGLRPDVMAILDAADICLHPSRRDAFPTTILEALAARVPVLATSTGGIPEIISGPELGVLVAAPPTPAAVAAGLASMLEAPERRRELAQAGREAFERRFTADPWVWRTRALYDEVIAEARRPRPHPLTRVARRAQVLAPR